MELPLILLLLVVLLLVSAFFTLSEMAIVTLNKNKLKSMIDEGNLKAKALFELTADSQKFIATIQLGLVLTGLFSSAFAVRYLAPNLSSFLTEIGINASLSFELSFIIIVILLAMFMVTVGVLVPKRIALKHAEKIAFKTYKTIKIFRLIVSPFTWVISVLANVILILFRINPKEDIEQVSEAEIISLIESSAESGSINEEESEMINSIFDFNDITAQEIMTPRTEVFMIDINTFSQNTIDQMIEENYSRIPIYDDTPDDIIGIVYIKDVFREARKVGFDQIDLRKIMNKPYFVPARQKINALFRELQASKNYMGILVDEYGGFQGIVTIEDLIEEIMGDIYDEYDEDITDVKEIEPNKYLVNGLLSIEEVNDMLEIEIPEDDSYETIAGFVLSHIGYIPEEKDRPELHFDTFSIKIEKMDEKRIDQVIITLNNNEDTEKEQSN